jgi:hypothetical protein
MALHREVEAPRRSAGTWGPIMALAGAAMITIMSAVAVTARPRHVRLERVEQAPRRTPAAADREAVKPPPLLCNQRVWRASPDGRAEQFEDCALQPPRR